jgi:hypothetical protein
MKMTNTNKPIVGITLGQMGHDGKKAMSFASSTVKAYAKVAIQLHQAACLTFYRAAQYGDCDSLNLFFAGLRVNDATALRVWIGTHSTFVDLENNDVRPWIKWNKEKGFAIIKGTEAHRKDMFTIDVEEAGKTMLLALKPFYDKNVKDKDALTLEDILNMLAAAAKNATKKADADGVVLSADVLNLVTSIKNCTAKELAAIERIVAE